MSNWALAVPSGRHSQLSAPATSTSGPAFTYGAWAELVAAAPPGVTGIMLLRTTALDEGQFSARLAVGSVGAEVVVATLAAAVTSAIASTADFAYLPIRVPHGSRLAIQNAAATSARSITWRVAFVTGGGLFPVAGSRIDLHGFTLGTMLGTPITAGASGAWGTGVEVVTATPRRARGVAITGWGSANAVAYRGGVGVFYGASDVLAAPVVAIAAQNGGNALNALATPQFLPCNIPAGSNLRLRAFHELAAAPTRALQLHLLY